MGAKSRETLLSSRREPSRCQISPIQHPLRRIRPGSLIPFLAPDRAACLCSSPAPALLAWRGAILALAHVACRAQIFSLLASRGRTSPDSSSSSTRLVRGCRFAFAYLALKTSLLMSSPLLCPLPFARRIPGEPFVSSLHCSSLCLKGVIRLPPPESPVD